MPCTEPQLEASREALPGHAAYRTGRQGLLRAKRVQGRDSWHRDGNSLFLAFLAFGLRKGCVYSGQWKLLGRKLSWRTFAFHCPRWQVESEEELQAASIEARRREMN